MSAILKGKCVNKLVEGSHRDGKISGLCPPRSYLLRTAASSRIVQQPWHKIDLSSNSICGVKGQKREERVREYDKEYKKTAKLY